MKNLPTTIRRVLTALMMSLMIGAALPLSAQEAEAPAAVEAEPVVNLNTATEAELVTLPGIGPSKAQAIIAHRERRAFRRVEDVMRVRGIGRSTFRRLRSRLGV
ncbi:MAG: ComEA family DNA-binding protein [Polyangiales bacterium]